jgi:hypothetical protein
VLRKASRAFWRQNFRAFFFSALRSDSSLDTLSAHRLVHVPSATTSVVHVTVPAVSALAVRSVTVPAARTVLRADVPAVPVTASSIKSSDGRMEE